MANDEWIDWPACPYDPDDGLSIPPFLIRLPQTDPKPVGRLRRQTVIRQPVTEKVIDPSTERFLAERADYERRLRAAKKANRAYARRSENEILADRKLARRLCKSLIGSPLEDL